MIIRYNKYYLADFFKRNFSIIAVGAAAAAAYSFAVVAMDDRPAHHRDDRRLRRHDGHHPEDIGEESPQEQPDRRESDHPLLPVRRPADPCRTAGS
ncbi:MAG: hypothetical protein MZU97_11065 [Bacillus subtilis]|nr:hypothetical protein [Bacillus subtilis]